MICRNATTVMDHELEYNNLPNTGPVSSPGFEVPVTNKENQMNKIRISKHISTRLPLRKIINVARMNGYRTGETIRITLECGHKENRPASKLKNINRIRCIECWYEQKQAGKKILESLGLNQ